MDHPARETPPQPDHGLRQSTTCTTKLAQQQHGRRGEDDEELQPLQSKHSHASDSDRLFRHKISDTFPCLVEHGKGNWDVLFRVDNLPYVFFAWYENSHFPTSVVSHKLRALSSGPGNTQKHSDECGHPSSLSGAFPTSNILPVIPRNLIGTFDFKHLEIFAHVDVIDFYCTVCIGQVP